MLHVSFSRSARLYIDELKIRYFEICDGFSAVKLNFFIFRAKSVNEFLCKSVVAPFFYREQY